MIGSKRPVDRIFPEKNGKIEVAKYETPAGKLVKGNSDNMLGSGWYFLPVLGFMKSFGSRSEAVSHVFAILEREHPEFIEKAMAATAP